MTKVTILGQSEQPAKQLKRIEFVKLIDVYGNIQSCGNNPHEYKNIALLRLKPFCGGYDFMFAWDGNPNVGILFLGHFNDGVV